MERPHERESPDQTLHLHPAVSGDFRAFLCTATGYETVGVREGKPFLEVAAGTIPVKTIELDRHRQPCPPSRA